MENKLETIPYVVHEGDMARLERSNRRLLIALAIALAIMFLNNVQDEYPQLADTYYQLSLEEMKHVTMLHGEVVKIIEELKRTREVPEGMQILYDYLHDRQIKWAAKIKGKQEQYKI